MLFGLSQIRHPEAWRHYIPKLLQPLIPVRMVMQLHGLGNLLLGTLFIRNDSSRFIAFLVLAWWASVVPAAMHVDWAIAVRDMAILLAVAAYLSILISQSEDRYEK